MEIYLLILLIIVAIINIVLIIAFRSKSNDNHDLILKVDALNDKVSKLENSFKDDFKTNREEIITISKDNRLELNATLHQFSENVLKSLDKLETSIEGKMTQLIDKTEKINRSDRAELTKNLKEFSESNVAQLEKFNSQVQEKLISVMTQTQKDNAQNRETISNHFKEFQISLDKNIESFNQLQREKFSQLQEKQNKLVEGTEKKLEEMRIMVDEKLQKTLNERLGQSFEMVNKQLESVQKGLGEMQNIAQDVGGLKKVLSNVKMRGGIGEVQLAMLLEQVLAPEQYQANVKTKQGSSDNVEFALKLPGRDENNSVVWLPIDAKFPKDIYEQLQTAYDIGDIPQIELAQKTLENTIKKMAKDIRDKYIDPPNTTDFGIMFLPFEGIYAEVVRKASLLNELQNTYKIIVTGPTTLAAILNSLQMGFKTLAIQKRSSEVWTTLGVVKKDFEAFAGLLDKAHKNIQDASENIDTLRGRRTKSILRKLRDVETLTPPNATIDNPAIPLLEDELDE